MAISSIIQNIRPNTPQSLIDIYLPIAASIAPCISRFPTELSDLTQALIVAHYIEQSTVEGKLTSESTRTGASASYQVLSGEGLAATRFGQQLLTLPTLACVQSLAPSPRFARSVKPCH